MGIKRFPELGVASINCFDHDKILYRRARFVYRPSANVSCIQPVFDLETRISLNFKLELEHTRLQTQKEVATRLKSALMLNIAVVLPPQNTTYLKCRFIDRCVSLGHLKTIASLLFYF